MEYIDDCIQPDSGDGFDIMNWRVAFFNLAKSTGFEQVSHDLLAQAHALDQQVLAFYEQHKSIETEGMEEIQYTAKHIQENPIPLPIAA